MKTVPAARRAARPHTLLAICPLLLTACVRTRVAEVPLVPEAALARVHVERAQPVAPGGLALGEATALLARHNPAVRRAQAEWRQAACVAAVPTPRANPTLEVGPLLFSDAIFESARLGVDAALGWALPLSRTRPLTDDVNRVRADAALAEACAVEREQYLRMRGEYVAVRTLTDLRAARERLLETASEAAQSATQAVAAGSATSLDVRLLELETAEVQAELFEVEEALATARGDLGVRLGVQVLDVGREPSELPPLPPAVPDAAALERLVLGHHPRLSALRASYAVAEKELRLEVARSVPDLSLGLTYEREDGDRLGLPLGVEIPLFDRNQPAIAEARGRRDALRADFEATLGEILGEVERARALLEARQRRLAFHEAQLEPAARTQELARTVLQQSGAFDMLRYLEVLRAARRAELHAVESRAEAYAAWSELERATGAPLLRFASESTTKSPPAREGEER